MQHIGSSTREQRVRATTLLAAVGMFMMGIHSTGAYFSDAHDGNISGTIGSIRITASGGTGANGLDFNMANVLPGEPTTITVDYSNSGANAEDVWLKFPNLTALSSFNDYGHYAQAHIASNGKSVFDSMNLNDHQSTCPDTPATDCRPLPSTLKIATNLAPGHSGKTTITIGYTPKLSKQPPAGTTAYFNEWPQADQSVIRASDGAEGNGLSFLLVATQRGQTP